MQKHDEKRNRSEGGRAHRQVVDIPEDIMGRIFGRGRRGEELIPPKWNLSDVLKGLSRTRVDPLHSNNNTWGGTRRDKGRPG